MTTWQPKQHGTYHERRAYREMRKSEIAAEKAAKDASAMTCQCCSRRIFAQSGSIAHHGYERPGTGYQTASCVGAKCLPWEVSRDALGELIKRLKGDIAEVKRLIKNLIDEKAEVPFTYDTVKTISYGNHKRTTNYVWFTRASFENTQKELNDKLLPLVEKHTLYGREYKAAIETLSDVERRIWQGRDTLKFDDLLRAHIERKQSELKNLVSFERECEERYASWKQTHSHFDKKLSQWIPL